MVDARGSPFSFVFGADGRLLSDTSPLGTQTLKRTLTDNGVVVEHRTPLGHATTYSSTATGGQTNHSIIHPDGSRSTRDVRLNGDIVATSADGVTTTTTVVPDPRFGIRIPFPGTRTVRLPSGLTLTTTETRSARTFDASTQRWTEQRIVSSGGNATTLTRSYDATGQTLLTTSPAGRTARMTVDGAGRPLQTQVGGLTPVILTYSDGKVASRSQGARLTQFTYTPNVEVGTPRVDAGYLQSVTDAEGVASEFKRDSRGRILLQIEAKDSMQEAITQLVWDGNNNIERVTVPGGQQHHFLYSSINSLAEYIAPLLPDEPTVSPSSVYEVTADREPLRETMPDGRTVTRSYRPDTGQLARYEYASPTEPTHFIEYDYYQSTNAALGAAAGRISGIRGPYGVNLTFQYDGPFMTREAWLGDVVGSVAYEFNNQFLRRREMVTPGVGTASGFYFGYDADRLLTCVTLAATGACTPLASTDLRLTRSPMHGQVVELRMGNVTEQVSYSDSQADQSEASAFGELRRQTVTAGGVVVLDILYDAPTARRDDVGRIRFMSEAIINPGTGVVEAREREFGYDDLKRLTSASDDASATGDETFEYDGNGNRTLHRLGVESPTQPVYDAQDRLMSYGSTLFTYGPNGEVASKTTPTVRFDYTYDAIGNLIGVVKSQAATTSIIEYLVDGKGRRVGKLVDSVLQRRWIYRNGLNPIAELDASGGLVSRFIYASKQNVPDAVVRGAKVYRIISDHLGSPRLAVNIQDSSDVAYRADYSAFGEPMVLTGASFLPFSFAGGLYDPDTGLLRFGVRDYDPAVGRWTAKDPIRFAGGQANFYVYAGNDPINRRDPRGLAVLLCRRVADLPLNSFFKLEHHFIKTNGRAGGAGTCGGGVPGHGQSDLPFDSMCMNDHSSESGDEVICEEVDVDEDCVAAKLNFGEELGPWAPPFNDCQTVAHDILAECSNQGTFYPFGGSEGAPGWLGSEGGTFGY